ncbi:MAG: hypothetical protein ACOCXM_11965 [Myxococcota bacterium]
MTIRHPEHEIKGLWFIAGQSYLSANLDPSVFQQFARALPPEFREVAEAPMASTWYPEDAAAHFLRAWLEVPAEGNRQRFRQMVGEASEQGLNRFFRAIARLASQRFLLRQTPTIFRQLRRGPATVTVEESDAGMVVHYRDFPFLDDPVYEDTFPAQLGALLHATTGDWPNTRVLDKAPNRMRVEVRLQ